MGSGGAGKGKPGRPNEEKQHAWEVNATRKAQGKTSKSVAWVSRSKARSQAYHARVSQPVPGDSIGAPEQAPPEPPARRPIVLVEGPGAGQTGGEILPSSGHAESVQLRGENLPQNSSQSSSRDPARIVLRPPPPPKAHRSTAEQGENPPLAGKSGQGIRKVPGQLEETAPAATSKTKGAPPGLSPVPVESEEEAQEANTNTRGDSPPQFQGEAPGHLCQGQKQPSHAARQSRACRW